MRAAGNPLETQARTARTPPATINPSLLIERESVDVSVSLRCLTEADGGAYAAPLGLDLAVPRRRRRDQVLEEVLGCMRDGADRTLEHGLVRLRGLLHSAHL